MMKSRPWPETQDVRTRRVFYIPGYDPMGPRRYRELYRSEGAKQADTTGYRLRLEGKPGSRPYGWRVETEINGVLSRADIEFMEWADIVQGSMDRSIPATFLLLVRLIWIYCASGALFRLMRLRKGPVIAALYPIFMLSAQLVLALALAFVVGFGISQFLPVWAGMASAIAFLVWFMRWLKRFDNRFFAYYLLHDYAFSAQFQGANPPELETRMRAFRARIDAALLDDVDEVLVVGHSSGAHIGVSVLADLLRERTPAPDAAKLAFLTVGQVVPMVSFLPEAKRLRGDLQFLCQQTSLTWVDVSAPGDGCTFALCDPVSVSGAAPENGKRWPLVISAAFTQNLSPERYEALRWRFFRLHFQYLCAFDLPGEYDYFQITAGPRSLARRYAKREPSPSRLETSLSGYTIAK